jgi:hypothetical protein
MSRRQIPNIMAFFVTLSLTLLACFTPSYAHRSHSAPYSLLP